MAWSGPLPCVTPACRITLRRFLLDQISETVPTMPVPTLAHPDPVRLTAFARGMLNEEETGEVETHVAVCEACCNLLSTLPDDEFVSLLRTTQNDLDFPSGPWDVARLTGSAARAIDTVGFDIPSSIAQHGSVPAATTAATTVATLAGGELSRAQTSRLSLDPDLPLELANHSRYRIVSRLGIGGMGTVYLAEHRLMDRPVALKVIRRDFLGNEALVERFRREVKAAARLPLHPNIVAAHDAEHAGDTHFGGGADRRTDDGQGQERALPAARRGRGGAARNLRSQSHGILRSGCRRAEGGRRRARL